MKKYKSLIILLAVLVVLVVAYVVTGQLKKKSAEKENEQKQIAVLDMSDITSIQYMSGLGNSTSPIFPLFFYYSFFLCLNG